MIKRVEDMSDDEWKLFVALELESLRSFQRWQLRTWLAMAGAIGLYLLPRFVDFMLAGIAVAGTSS